MKARADAAHDERKKMTFEKRFICASCNAQFDTLAELEDHWNRIGIVRGKVKK